ncbi:cytidine deaminase [Amycolatopsis sp. SID8362]|uniref:cytidine deaminase family protein n=1 Tax=Amycolatopsis sp. SID8362 TaxID=2690346 RepID=UPI001369ED90|nr:cytidine deaminase [Amycolatopsis sp. SID8362]NBH09708.1 cytidine deaminase [Amycolatopsis sp. SID8362]NED46401.1 cytidine deaminase [Amycolatopsis sp. SID8362]
MAGRLSRYSRERVGDAVSYRDPGELEADDLLLLRRARDVGRNAFNPVSGFLVGAAVRDRLGRTFAGTFLESSALPLSVCAEPAALLAAFSAGSRDLVTIAVAGGDPTDSGSDIPITPCGGCRQRIYDTTGGAAVNIRVLCSNLALDRVLDVHILDLLPYAFDSSVLPAAAWKA